MFWTFLKLYYLYHSVSSLHLCLNILGTKEPEPAGRDRGTTLAQHPAEVRGSWGGKGDRRAWPPWRGDEAIQRWRGGKGGGCRGQEKEKRTLCGWQRNVMKKRITKTKMIWASAKRKSWGRAEEEAERREAGYRGRKRESETGRDCMCEKCPDVTSSEEVQPHSPTLINKVTQRWDRRLTHYISMETAREEAGSSGLYQCSAVPPHPACLLLAQQQPFYWSSHIKIHQINCSHQYAVLQRSHLLCFSTNNSFKWQQNSWM